MKFLAHNTVQCVTFYNVLQLRSPAAKGSSFCKGDLGNLVLAGFQIGFVGDES